MTHHGSPWAKLNNPTLDLWPTVDHHGYMKSDAPTQRMAAMTNRFSIGDRVQRGTDIGTITEITPRQIVVRLDATGATKQSPWGEYTDKGGNVTVFAQFAERLLKHV